MTFTMNLSHQAKKEMAKLDRPLIRRLRDRLRELAENPLNPRLPGKWKRIRTDVIFAWGIGALSFK
jgi:mRNA-degrading endonuclease RelE of RelBE toxin-antitoxin system